MPLTDTFTGIYAGFAIFSVLGYMKQQKCKANFRDVVAGGPSLAFIAYPEGKQNLFSWLLFAKPIRAFEYWLLDGFLSVTTYIFYFIPK